MPANETLMQRRTGKRMILTILIPLGIANVVLFWLFAKSAATGPVGTGMLATYLGIFILLEIILGLVARSVWRKQVFVPLAHVAEVMERVSEGSYDARTELNDPSEVRAVAAILDTMLDRIAVLLETEVDRDRLQQQISELLDIVSSSAEGDLSRRADVTADVMGALADSFNMMAEELGSLIREVQGAATQVGGSTGEIGESTEKMAQDAEEQVLQITSTATVDVQVDIVIIRGRGDLAGCRKRRRGGRSWSQNHRSRVEGRRSGEQVRRRDVPHPQHGAADLRSHQDSRRKLTGDWRHRSSHRDDSHTDEPVGAERRHRGRKGR